MAFGDTNQAILRYAEESSWGVTPSTAGTVLRITGESLVMNADSVVSNEIVSDRQVSDVIRTATDGGGSFDWELSYGNLDDLLEGALMSDWQLDTPSSGTDTLVNGTTKKSYTLEKEFDDLTLYQTFAGARVNEFSIDFTTGEVVTGSLSVMSKAPTTGGSTSFTGSSAAPTNDPVNATNHISAFNEGGSSLDGALGFSISTTNNLRNQREIGTADPAGIGLGRFEVTGTLRAYFQSWTLFQKFENDTESSISVTVTDGGSNVYTFDIEQVAYTGAEVVAGGVNDDVLVDMTWQGEKDTSTSNSLKITRS